MQLEQVNDIIEIVDDAAGIVRRISALEAYRKYSWIKDAPIANSVGNYRGMVISAKWKTVYLYSGSVLEKTGNILILLSVVDELMKSREKIASIVHGTDDRVTKAAKLSSQVSGIALRVIAHSALETISALNWGLRVTRWANIGFWLASMVFAGG